MSRKRTIIVALVGLNLLLLAGLVLSTHEPPAAFAQGRGRPGDYLMATCQVHEDYDALIVVNSQRGGLFVWIPRSPVTRSNWPPPASAT
ncbi:MAG TPA: hypothetical protein P5572_11175 [Phycisphaerae bacterium]|nr:hypothetical protein [Phycisphaerae bacterium]